VFFLSFVSFCVASDSSKAHRKNFFSLNQAQDELQRAESNDTECEICEILARVAEIIIKEGNYNESQVLNALEQICAALPKKVQPECKLTIKLLAKKIITELESGAKPSVVCQTLKACPKSEFEIVREFE